MVAAIAVAGGAGALTGLLRSQPEAARLSAQEAPAPGPGMQPGAVQPTIVPAGTAPAAAAPAKAAPARTRPARAARASTPPAASPTPVARTSSPETDQLQRLAAVVRQSSAARRITVNATGGVENCTIGTGDGIAMMNQSIRTREAALSEASSLSGDALPGGQALIGSLVQAMNYSISADHRFIAWMRHAGSAGTCPAPQNGDPAWDAGVALSELAMNEKYRFVGEWNPLAARFGLPTYSALNV